MAGWGDSAVAYLIGYGIFAAIPYFFTIIAICRGKQWHGRLRILSVMPFGIGAALTTAMFNLIRTSSNPELPIAVRAAFGLPSIAATFAAVYCFILMLFMHNLRKPKGGRIRSGAKVERRSSFFYILLLDLAVIACLVAGVALTGSQVPWTYGACNSASNHDSMFVRGLEAEMTREIKYRRSPSAIFDDRKAACKLAVSIQYISTLMSVQIATQSAMLPPIIALPTLLRLLFFIAIRRARRPGLKLRDEELGPSEHPASCNGDKKSQCWACDAVICTACKVNRPNVPAPRTTHHVTDCYAVCTACYVTKWSSQPAALSAAFHPTNLSKHHAECGLEKHRVLPIRTAPRGEYAQVGLAVAKLLAVVDVEVCAPCAGKSPEELSALRERREEVMLQRLLARRIFCAKCEKPVPREKRRWWICATGDHECHWGGHEPGRLSR